MSLHTLDLTLQPLWLRAIPERVWLPHFCSPGWRLLHCLLCQTSCPAASGSAGSASRVGAKLSLLHLQKKKRSSFWSKWACELAVTRPDAKKEVGQRSPGCISWALDGQGREGKRFRSAVCHSLQQVKCRNSFAFQCKMTAQQWLHSRGTGGPTKVALLGDHPAITVAEPLWLRWLPLVMD